MNEFIQEPWEHPDWYDLHDNTWTAGPDREPEHYREFLLSLPPLDERDHLFDLGTGTGKLAALIAKGYPSLGAVTLIEPNLLKLEKAQTRLAALLPEAKINALPYSLGEERPLPENEATLATIGSVLMPYLELFPGDLFAGLDWMQVFLSQAFHTLRPGAWLYDLETLAAPWTSGDLTGPARRLNLLELMEQLQRAGFEALECTFRFRDRVVVRARRPVH